MSELTAEKVKDLTRILELNESVERLQARQVDIAERNTALEKREVDSGNKSEQEKQQLQKENDSLKLKIEEAKVSV